MTSEENTMPADGQAKPKHYKELLVWQKGMNLAKLVYKLTMRFPAEQRYGLTSQLRRAAISVPSNIAEGQGRRTTADFVKYLSIAYGSLREVETQALIARRLNYVAEVALNKVLNHAGEVGRLLNGLMASLVR